MEACRARLYRISKQNSSGETPVPTAEWKESCKRAIIPNVSIDCQRLLRAYMNFHYRIFLPHTEMQYSIRPQSKEVWDLAVDIMNIFERGKLKDQRKLSSAVAKPEFKQYYLAPIRSLEPQEQSFLLLKCKNGEISLSELKKEASVLKQLIALRKNFVKPTNSTNWEDCVAQFPLFACESELKKFIVLDFSKGIPKPFLDFCKRAKSTKDAGALNSSVDHTYVQYGRIVGYVLKENPLELSGHVITSSFPGFQGADMIIVPINQVRKPFCENYVYLAYRCTGIYH